MTRDERDGYNVKQDMKYDQRNLLIEMRLVKPSTNPNVASSEVYQMFFDYDEAGNRVRKRVYFYQGQEPEPIFEGDNPQLWDLMNDEYYSRDISGKEIAIYHSTSLYQWNVWGTDNTGKITANGDKFFYLKDHLGTIRVVLDVSNNIVSANDYDPWGYPLDGRSYQSDNTDYKFTGKQRDTETGWDYFGARYYDARIARWGGVESLLEKYLSFSPYQYGLLNPMRLVDADGKDVFIFGDDAKATVEYMNEEKKSSGLKFSLDENGKLSITGKPKDRSAMTIYNAIKSEDIKVVLFTVRKDKLADKGNQYMSVGAYFGSTNNPKNPLYDGKLTAIQYFNLPQAIAYNDAGGSSVGVSAFHEIKEAFLGAFFYPGTTYSESYNYAHEFAQGSDPIGLEQPVPHVDAEGKLYYKNQNEDENAKAKKYYPEY